METYHLSGFLLKEYVPGEGKKLSVHKAGSSTEDWIDIDVPGDVHQAMIAAGRLADPFYDRNELDCAWMEEREWWYRTQFTIHRFPLSDERLLLVFHGLDTYATIWLNGEQLGKHSNMFRPAIFDVTKKIRMDQLNTLALCFDPPSIHVADKTPLSWQDDQVRSTKRNWMRKAQFGYGWDWGPRLPTIGIWRPVELLRQRRVVINGVHFATDEIDIEAKRALVSVKVEVERFAGGGLLDLRVSLIPPGEGGEVVEQLVLMESGDRQCAEVHLIVDNPTLWWTHDLGKPALYTLQVSIVQEGEKLDEAQHKVGIRTIKLNQSHDHDEPGTRFFRFVLNGVPIFARGANWIPASSFVGSLTEQHYEQLIRMALDANMNMFRIWGGGIYEHDAFYDICDRLGILVWQDFMFACAPYPDDDPNFVEEVRKEVRYQVRRNRNRPCLALWCGNNENQMLHYWTAQGEGQWFPVPGTLLYETIIPEIIEELDSYIPYWPGSPEGGAHPNSQLEGDVHDWHVWHGYPIDGLAGEELQVFLSSGPKAEDVSFIHYEQDMGRFISEFGMHASPVYETLRRCIPADQLYHHSPGMDHHNKDNPKNKGDNLMLNVTDLPRDLDEYIDYSMIAQAEGLKFGIEHFRRRKPHCSGTLIWQFNDCWPVLSWSILDYYGFGKAGYYYLRRAFSPVLASFKALPDGEIELWLSNDTLQDVEDTIEVHHGSFAEGTIRSERLEVMVPANSSSVVWSKMEAEVVGSPAHYLAVRSLSNLFPVNRHFFAAIKDLQRQASEPQVEITALNRHELSVRVHAPVYVYFFTWS
jgi:beta-mannosidase